MTRKLIQTFKKNVATEIPAGISEAEGIPILTEHRFSRILELSSPTRKGSFKRSHSRTTKKPLLWSFVVLRAFSDSARAAPPKKTLSDIQAKTPLAVAFDCTVLRARMKDTPMKDYIGFDQKRNTPPGGPLHRLGGL